jgi:hypothetical protein
MFLLKFWAKKEVGVLGSFEHNLKNFNQTKTLDVTSFSWKEVFVQKKIGDSLRTKFWQNLISEPMILCAIIL